MVRILGVDWGRARIGLAVSDELGLTAQSLGTFSPAGESQALDTVAGYLTDLGIEAIVVGLPRKMDGSDGPSAEAAREFARRLKERSRLPVHLWDERFTSLAAERVLIEAGVRRRARRGAVDRVAAALILQGFLDRRRAGVDRESPDG